MPAGTPLSEPLTLRGRARAVALPGRVLLAPMEGITERCFRRLVIALGGVGGACTEFLRISASPVPERVARRELGDAEQRCPVAVQLMAGGVEHLVASVVNAEAAGAAWIDLNFGCPAPTVFGHCAGSALLARPDLLRAITATAVAATGLPVSAKVRAGIADPGSIEEVVAAIADAGAAMLTVHGRLRVHSYAEPARWDWIARAVAAWRRAAPGRPLVGNGGVERPEDAAGLVAASGCDAVMVGRAALADPWIFRRIAGGPAAGAAEAARFAADYAAELRAGYGERTALARVKQLAKWYRAGDLFAGREEERQRLLRVQTLEELVAGIAQLA